MAPSFDPIEAKMRATGLSDAAVSAFKLNFDALAGGESGMVRKKKKMMMVDEDDDGRRIDGGKGVLCYFPFCAALPPFPPRSDPSPARASS